MSHLDLGHVRPGTRALIGTGAWIAFPSFASETLTRCGGNGAPTLGADAALRVAATRQIRLRADAAE